ncbi:flagellinolysin [Inconstantimicrobium mannanitabidum]|uniref:Flagellin n=1 Tax=Inconstantimicrobium mannanitabidum TaxID=1604901 RepID=A0ACB5RDM5_9CLOT|nr:flagellinolysin [Clostridium sp. TW13]GKX67205.1 flagellin [Clostridium sp. TW13]
MEISMNAGINAHRYYTISQNNSGKSISKLSSGLRINQAADDAAGLSISEGMRAQIRGLDQGSRNVEDGISLAQTAEGGLDEIHKYLQRGRELSVQANNGTLTDDDKKQIQKEIDQIKKGIDDIANGTEFNKIHLLNESSISAGNKVSADNIIKGLKGGWLEKAEDRIFNTYGIKGTGSSNLNIYLDEGTPYGELAHAGGPTGNLELHIDLADFNPASGQDGQTIEGKGYYADRVIAHEMTHAVMDEVLGATKMNDMHTNNALWFVEGTAEFTSGADERLKSVIGKSDQTGIDTTKMNSLISRANDLLNGAAWNGDDQDYSAGYLITKYVENKLKGNGKDLKDVVNDIKVDSSGTSATTVLQNSIGTRTGSTSYANFKTDFASNVGNYITNSIHLNWGADETDTGSIAGSDNGGSALNAEDVINESGVTAKDQPLTGFKVVWPKEDDTKPLTVQVGANQGETLEIKRVNATSAALGVDQVNVVSGATDGINKFESAINKVSQYRADIGAIQNRLEHTMSIDDNTGENLQSSESKVRDVDMAKEMMSFAKSGILSKAAMSMMSQANSSANSVLSLLQ